MTKPTPEQIQRANFMLGSVYKISDYGRPAYSDLTALADTIAELDDMQAERDKARADLGEIDRIAQRRTAAKRGQTTAVDDEIANIAAPYRVETDPLAEAFKAIGWSVDSPRGDRPARLRAELAKRGLEIGRSA